MNIKKILKFGLPLVGATAIAISLPLALTSCSNNQTSDLNVKTFDAKVMNPSDGSNTFRNTVKQDGDTAHYITSPSLNKNALDLARETFKEITKKQLQKDFDFAITRIYDAYEFEQENSHKRDDEIEASIEKIEVVNKYLEDPTGLTWIVNVTYEVDRDDDKGDELVTQTRLFQIKPEFASQKYIEELKKFLKGKDSEINNGNGGEVELDDLYEFYFGDNEDIDDLDDVGVFDLMNLYRKKYNSKDGSLLGYNIDLLAFEPQLTDDKDIVSDDYTKLDWARIIQRDNNDISQESVNLFTPSISHNYFFYANENNMPKFRGKKINLLLDENKLQTLTIQQFTDFINIFPQVTPLNYLINGTPNQEEDNEEQTNVVLEKTIECINLLTKQNSSLTTLNATMFGANGSIKVNENDTSKDYIVLTYDFGNNKTDENYSKINFYLSKSLFKQESSNSEK